ncbi:probable aspartic proteinase GIP1 [Jatropha curcas]|uniref:probable aspartic proteinase GIP1 n=1 Tax=Jatropha curcas TaxID=180498 RepID=UPI0005FAAA47|nr:probable aspartic proteinase GIP1 [Jatropha curcas]
MSLSLLFFLSLISLLLLPLQEAAFLLPIRKDHTTHQYITTLYLKTPLQATDFVLDLGASFFWVDCHNNYTSTTYQHIPCGTPLCDSFESRACGNCFEPPGPACANDTCEFFPENSVTRQVNLEAALIDSLALPTTDGSTQGPLALVESYIFSCARTSLLQGLAKGVSGMAAMGRSNISLQAQLRAAFSAPSYFALCLSGSRQPSGVAFIGTNGPYNFLPGIDVSKSLSYTPLILNPIGGTVITYVNQPSAEYFVGLTSIKVNGKVVALNQTLLAIDNETGFGGAKISTVVPYTILHTSIYKAVTESFVKESSAMNLTLTKAAKPFSFCYPAMDIVNTRVGPGVPAVDLVMQGEDVYWRIFGSNSMVRVASKGVDVWCLGFMDGGANPRTSIVIGGYQMEDNLLQFDLESNRLGFTSSLLIKGTKCADFHFTAIKKP